MDARPGPRWVGTALVLIQFVLIGLLASKAGALFARSQAPAGAWVALLAGVALGLWALAANRPGNFNITPAATWSRKAPTAGSGTRCTPR